MVDGTGAQPAQLLNDKEVTMATAWNGRLYAIEQNGAPVKTIWKNQILRTDVWADPERGREHAERAEVVRFHHIAAPQARLSSLIPYGFVNDKAGRCCRPSGSRNCRPRRTPRRTC